ncbi:MAG: WYL domain-containing protein [Acidimicrobiaceae bacterium]|nr:WYL domain-containing protein [Acidimicrobiaceae bacterium]
MNKHQQKLKRLLNLTTTLLESRTPLTAKQLRERLADEAYSSDKSDTAFRRTFERDKKDLISMGVPIEVRKHAYSELPVDHYYIDQSVYAERDLRFTSGELSALLLAARQVRLPGATKAFLKTGIPDHQELKSTGVAEGSTPYEQTEAGLVVDLPFNDTVSTLASCAARRKAIRYRYRKADGSTSSREVEPWQISFKEGRWYMVGWDRHRRHERNFRIDRIRHPIVEIGGFTSPVGQTAGIQAMKPWEFGSGEPVEVKIWVDAELAGWASQKSGTSGCLQADDSLILKLRVRNRPALRTFVLSMLEHAKILEPQWIKDELVAWLEFFVVDRPSQVDVTEE